MYSSQNAGKLPESESGRCPGKKLDEAHLDTMELNDPAARGKMVIYKMINIEDAEAKQFKAYQKN